jgi:hypothetical protein
MDLGQQRLLSQEVARPRFERPAEVVAWLGAMQAQDYLGALWAVALRLPHATEREIERALEERTIVRTWPMRGTIHFVAPADVRWMLELLAPRVVQRSQARLRQLGLDARTIADSGEVVGRALEGGRQIARHELYGILEAAGISTAGQRGIHILGQLAHARLICFGARQGKQPTFALLDEWAPGAKSLPRDEALAALALRYFTGHGPATVQDLVWWAGLTVADAREGVGAAAPQLGSATIDGQTYYFAKELPKWPGAAPGVSLLPPFDEFLVGYRDRSAVLEASYSGLVVPGANGVFNPIVVTGGRVTGTWKRTIKRDRVEMRFSPFAGWDDEQLAAIRGAAERYGAFLGLDAVVA